MLQALRRSRLGLALLLLTALPATPQRPDAGPPSSAPGTEALQRAQLEQELVLAERTAVLLGALHDHEARP